MLFNSYAFICCFLPVTYLGFHLLGRFYPGRAPLIFLSLASLFFYGWWDPRYLGLILPLMLFNFLAAKSIVRLKPARRSWARWTMITGVTANLAALGYFKYANFFVDNVNWLTGQNFLLQQIVLPLGISFFTFQKIALLVDVYHEKVSDFTPVNYSLFVLFFPQLIAGPIVHHAEIMPQLTRLRQIPGSMIIQGLSLFILGLAKKVLIADPAAAIASPLFLKASSAVGSFGFWEAWTAALGYTTQLYFDFSGYSDMAIGLGLLFGIRLPINFNSPYKASSIIDFWRRWHMTLSRFLRDYLYIPLGGNRSGEGRRYLNLYLTMLLGGFWHGAGWTFVVWGALHGLYLTVNHAWHSLSQQGRIRIVCPAGIGRLLTFVCVVIAWIFFRSPDVDTALRILHTMIAAPAAGLKIPLAELGLCAALLGIAWFMPNSQEILGYRGVHHTASEAIDTPAPAWRWQASAAWALGLGCILAFCLMHLSKISEFIYFQF